MTFWFSALSLAGCGAEFADNETVVSQAVGTTYGLDQFSRPACLLPEIIDEMPVLRARVHPQGLVAVW